MVWVNGYNGLFFKYPVFRQNKVRDLPCDDARNHCNKRGERHGMVVYIPVRMNNPPINSDIGDHANQRSGKEGDRFFQLRLAARVAFERVESMTYPVGQYCKDKGDCSSEH